MTVAHDAATCWCGPLGFLLAFSLMAAATICRVCCPHPSNVRCCGRYLHPSGLLLWRVESNRSKIDYRGHDNAQSSSQLRCTRTPHRAPLAIHTYWRTELYLYRRRPWFGRASCVAARNYDYGSSDYGHVIPRSWVSQARQATDTSRCGCGPETQPEDRPFPPNGLRPFHALRLSFYHSSPHVLACLESLFFWK